MEQIKNKYLIAGLALLIVIVVSGTLFVVLRKPKNSTTSTNNNTALQQSQNEESITPKVQTDSWKTYTNAEHGVTLKYPPEYYVHELSGPKLNVAINKYAEFPPQATTSATPLYGIKLSMKDCYLDSADENAPCWETPRDALNARIKSNNLDPTTIITKNINAGQLQGTEIDGVIADTGDNNGLQGTILKLAFLSNEIIPSEGKLIVFSLSSTDEAEKDIFDTVLSTLQLGK